MREYRQTLIEPCRLVDHIVIVAVLTGRDQHNHYRQMLVAVGVRRRVAAHAGIPA